MANGFRFVFECPTCRHNINLQKTCIRTALKEGDVFELFGHNEMSCAAANCGWRGKVSAAKLLQITSFQWIVGWTS